MRNYRWTGADQSGTVSGGWGLRLRPIDMAKIGMLMLDEGRWQGRQVVPTLWIRQMSTPSPQAAAQDYGYYCWISSIVQSEPQFGAMGFKGQFITVLPNKRAVIVMTAILPTDGGLRTGTYLNIYRRIVNDHILPAMTAIPRPTPTETSRQALRHELELSRHDQGKLRSAIPINGAREKWQAPGGSRNREQFLLRLGRSVFRRAGSQKPCA